MQESVPPYFDWNYGLARVDGDRELLLDLLNLFVDEAPSMLESLRQAAAEGEAPLIEQAAHTLRGAVSNFGAGRAVEAALRLEQIAHQRELTRAGVAFRELEIEVLEVLASIKAQNSEVA